MAAENSQNQPDERQLMESLELVWTEKEARQSADISLREAQLVEDKRNRDILREGLTALRQRLGITASVPVPIQDSDAGRDNRSNSTTSAPTTPASKPKRFRSPQAVATVVACADHPLTREEIKAELERRNLIPESWMNPTNAISTATLRAKERGLIVEVETNRFGPPEATDRPTVEP